MIVACLTGSRSRKKRGILALHTGTGYVKNQGVLSTHVQAYRIRGMRVRVYGTNKIRTVVLFVQGRGYQAQRRSRS